MIICDMFGPFVPVPAPLLLQELEVCLVVVAAVVAPSLSDSSGSWTPDSEEPYGSSAGTTQGCGSTFEVSWPSGT